MSPGPVGGRHLPQVGQQRPQRRRQRRHVPVFRVLARVLAPLAQQGDHQRARREDHAHVMVYPGQFAALAGHAVQRLAVRVGRNAPADQVAVLLAFQNAQGQGRVRRVQQVAGQQEA